MAKKLHGAAAKAHAKKKRGKAKKRPRRNPAAAPKRRSATGYTSGAGRVRRRKLNPRRTHRRRSNPTMGGASGKRLAMMVGMAVVGGAAGIFAAKQVEAHVPQSPQVLGLAEIALAGLGLFAAIKFKQPVLGFAFAAGAGATGGLNLLNSVSSPSSSAPAVPAAGAPPPQMPPAAGAEAYGYPQMPPGMGAVVDYDDDMGGAEGMAAVEDANEDGEFPSDYEETEDSTDW